MPTSCLVVLVHGFTASPEAWGRFPELLDGESDLHGFSYLFWQYPTKLDLSNLVSKLALYGWTNDPAIRPIGQALRTELDERADAYERIVLVGHSMGGLVIQSFVIEEILRNSTTHLDRLTDVVLYGTPSAGLAKARWFAPLKNQIADMSDLGPFITSLRREWVRLVDEQRGDETSLARFQLTVVAGLTDSFVPRSSVLDPFDYALKKEIPGNHSEIVKPKSRDSLSFRILKARLVGGAMTRQQRALVNGEATEVVSAMAHVEAAYDLNDLEALAELAHELLEREPAMPLVERKLGIALLDHEEYGLAAQLLQRFLDFEMPDGSGRPFAEDQAAIQQLAIALSGAGDGLGAVQRLVLLRSQLGESPETLGVLAGRFKRQWQADEDNHSIGWRALRLYQEALGRARELGDVDQLHYNGVNAAYLSFALGDTAYADLAREVADVCGGAEHRDYWTYASKGEAHVLLGEYPLAGRALQTALAYGPAPRHVDTTVQQITDILVRQGRLADGTNLPDMVAFLGAQPD